MTSSTVLSAPTREHFRRVLSGFATGVTVVASLTEDGPVGFSCQSFSSLSLDPPMVLVLPARSSTSWPRIEQTGRFCVNVLATDQRSLCADFARSGGDKFAGVGWFTTSMGSPALDGAAAWIDCSLKGVADGGDHLIVTGHVHGLAADENTPPLLFHRGRYAEIRTNDEVGTQRCIV